ncbi:pyruvate formate lyase family protein [Syntrophobotulus glycolicus]|nr:pyruvate formate lyase family protein [Syntrophobotulus glycolicus]
MSNANKPGLSDRIQRLYAMRNELYDSEVIPHRAQVYGKVFSRHPALDLPAKIALAFEEFLSEKKISVLPGDVLAGYAYKYSWDLTDPHKTPDSYNAAEVPPYDPFCIDDEVERIKAYLGGDEHHPAVKKLRFFQKGVHSWLFKHNSGGHIIPGQQRILTSGLKALQDEAKTELGREHTDSEKSYISAMLRCAEAFSNYILRYSEEAENSARSIEDPSEKKQLLKISTACKHISKNPPQSFFEAVQLVWLVHEVLITDMPVNCVISVGRLDLYLDSFYQADLAAGHITGDEAQEIIDALWLKFAANEMCYQNVTIGGTTVSGELISNPITLMCLRATERLRCDQPLLALRYAPDMPEELWEESLNVLRSGTGFPSFFHDAACIAVKERQGLSHEDAVNFAVMGCVELTGCGNDFSNTESMRINIPLLLEFMLNRGVQRLTGEVFPLHNSHDLDSLESFDEFYAWFKRELRAYINLGLESADLIESFWGRLYPAPFLSFTMKGCVQKGRDVADGGPIYNNSVLNGGGFASTADSLAAIKKLVFDEKIMTLSELAVALDQDYKGYEHLLRLISACPKYGNDDDAVDRFVRDIVDIFIDEAEGRKNSRGGTYGIGLYTVQDHAKMGYLTGALPDGRLAGTALSNGFASVQGKDISGPTALINSAVKAEISGAGNGMVLDLKFSPQFLQNPSNAKATRHLINSYFARGGIEIQINVVNSETLLAAKREPEKYKNLVVRVSGFSAYFCSLLPATQDEIIARTEHGNF